VVAATTPCVTAIARGARKVSAYEPAPFRGGVGTDQLQKVWSRSQRYSR